MTYFEFLNGLSNIGREARKNGDFTQLNALLSVLGYKGESLVDVSIKADKVYSRACFFQYFAFFIVFFLSTVFINYLFLVILHDYVLWAKVGLGVLNTILLFFALKNLGVFQQENCLLFVSDKDRDCFFIANALHLKESIIQDESKKR